MATASMPPLFDSPDWHQHSRAEGAQYLLWVERLVSKEQDKRFGLKSQSGSAVKLKITGLDHTIYRGKVEEVNGWGKFYLPQAVKMRVFGVVEGTSCPCDQLVLMTCEDKKVYAYDGEELHEVASDLETLVNKGIDYPASKTYYNGEAFKDMTEDDWMKVRKGAVGRKLDEEHQKRVKANKSIWLECLK